MRYRNATTDTLIVPTLGVTVEPGDLTPDLSAAQAKGFDGQGDVWQPEKKPAKAAAKKPAETEPTPDATSSGDDEQKENAS